MFKIFNEYGGNPKNIGRVISHAIHIPAEPPRGFDTGYIDKHISQPGYFSNKNGTDWKEAAKYATIAGVPITINNKTK